MTEQHLLDNRLNFLAKAQAWAKVDPLFTTHSLKGAEAIFSGSSTTTFNTLILDPTTERGAFKIIDEARRQVFQDNHFAVWSWHEGQLQNLPVQAGAVEEMLVMTGQAKSLRADTKTLDDIAATHAHHAAHLMDVGSILADVFANQDSDKDGSSGDKDHSEIESIMVQSLYAAQEDVAVLDNRISYYLLYQDGLAAATGSFILNGNTAGLYDIAVRPALQKRGLGRKIFMAVLKAALDSGAENVTLQATADGAKLYEDAGFKAIGRCWCLDIV